MKHFTVSIVALLFSACAAEPNDAGDTPDDIVRTRVYLQPDGRDPVVHVDHITPAEHAAELAARDVLQGAPAGGAHPRIAVDPGCGSASLWIFDGLNNQLGTFPFNHELCVFRNNVSGCLDLRTMNRYCLLNPNGTVSSCATWGTTSQSAIGSYWSGDSEGEFAGFENPFSPTTPFGIYDRQDNAAVVNTRGADPSGVAYAYAVCFW